jgi:uncharacterized membrane protein
MSTVQVKRHIAKTISYRILGTLQTGLLSWIFTGSWQIATSIGLIEFCVKPVMYFIHERVWYTWIPYGVIQETTHVGTSKK